EVASQTSMGEWLLSEVQGAQLDGSNGVGGGRSHNALTSGSLGSVPSLCELFTSRLTRWNSSREPIRNPSNALIAVGRSASCCSGLWHLGLTPARGEQGQSDATENAR